MTTPYELHAGALLDEPGLCHCARACQPHVHWPKDRIICMHDPFENHSHCPQATHSPLRSHKSPLTTDSQ